MFSIVREQGRLAELAPVIRLLAGEQHRHGPWRPGSSRCWSSSGWRTRPGASSRGSPPRASTASASRCGSPRSPTSPTPARRSGTREIAAIVYPELEPLAGANVMIGHLVAYYGSADRYLGMLAATLGERERAAEHFERALELNRRMGAGDLARAHGLRVRAAAARRRARPSASVARSCSPRRPSSPSGSGWRACSRRARALGASAAGARALPDGLSPREVEILQPRRARAQQPRDRRRAVHQRAHRGQPHPQHPAQDRMREPHRGGVLRPSARPRRGAAVSAR